MSREIAQERTTKCTKDTKRKCEIGDVWLYGFVIFVPFVVLFDIQALATLHEILIKDYVCHSRND
jgi:hypothetical protein